jgi:hypothetical protein
MGTTDGTKDTNGEWGHLKVGLQDVGRGDGNHGWHGGHGWGRGEGGFEIWDLRFFGGDDRLKP